MKGRCTTICHGSVNDNRDEKEVADSGDWAVWSDGLGWQPAKT